MKKKGSCILPALCLLLLLPAILLIVEWRMPAFYSESYYAELPKMVRHLKRAEGKRLIVVGGSSVAFSIDTALLENLLSEYGYEYTVCPMGLYAAVGTSVMLDLTEPQLREGDVVVLAFEPTSETMSDYFGASAYWKCAESDPQLLCLSDSGKRAALAGAYPGYLQERWNIKTSGQYPQAVGVYAASSFDDTCNMTYVRAGNTMAVGYDISKPIDLDAVSVSEAFSQRVQAFCRQADRMGAQVMLSFSPMNRSALVDGSEETLLAFFNRLCAAFGCTPITDLRTCVMDSGWFYDSNVHLNTPGAQKRTNQLAADLLTALGCCQPLSFEEPELPASIASLPVETAGDDAFLFEPLDGGYLISGLNEQGQEATELTVPAMWNGLPVVGLTAGALEGGENLVQLRLPASIQSIPDGLFLPCPHLERLILEHTDAPCAITAHSLDGAPQLRIFVPQAAYFLYRDGVGCEQNLWQPYLNRIYTY